MAAEKTVASLNIKLGVKADGSEKAERELKGLGRQGKRAGNQVESGTREGRRGLRRLQGAARTTGRVISATAKGAKAALGGIGVVVAAVGAAATAAFSVFDRLTGDIDAQRKLAEATGVTFEEFQRLSFATTQSGGSAEDLSRGLRFLRKGLEDVAQKGAGPANDALNDLGLSVSSLQGLDAQTQLGIISDALQGVDDQATRTRLSAALLGEESGPKLASLLAEGSAGIDKLAGDAQILSDEQQAAATALQDSLGELKNTVLAASGQALEPLIPIITDVVSGITEWFDVNRDVIQSGIDSFLDGLTGRFELLAPIVETIIDIGRELFEIIDALGISFSTSEDEVSGFTAAVELLLIPLDAVRFILDQIADAADSVGDAIRSATGDLEVFSTVAQKAASIRGRLFGGGEDATVGQATQTEEKTTRQRERQRSRDARDTKRAAEQEARAVADEARREAAAAEARNRGEANLERLSQKYSQSKRLEPGEAQEFARLAAQFGTEDQQQAARRATRKPRKGGGKRKAPPTSPVTLSQAVSAIRGGTAGATDFDALGQNLRGLAAQTPKAKDIEPTVAITNFFVTINQTINGARKDPVQFAADIGREVKRALGAEVRRVGEQLPSNLVV